MHADVHTYTHISIDMRYRLRQGERGTQTYIFTQAHLDTDIDICIGIQTNIYKDIDKYRYTQMNRDTHRYSYIDTFADIQLHTYRHINIHTEL